MHTSKFLPTLAMALPATAIPLDDSSPNPDLDDRKVGPGWFLPAASTVYVDVPIYVINTHTLTKVNTHTATMTSTLSRETITKTCTVTTPSVSTTTCTKTVEQTVTCTATQTAYQLVPDGPILNGFQECSAACRLTRADMACYDACEVAFPWDIEHHGENETDDDE